MVLVNGLLLAFTSGMKFVQGYNLAYCMAEPLANAGDDALKQRTFTIRSTAGMLELVARSPEYMAQWINAIKTARAALMTVAGRPVVY